MSNNPTRYKRGAPVAAQRAAMDGSRRAKIGKLTSMLNLHYGFFRQVASDPKTAHLIDLLADMRPESAREVILAIPIARKAERMMAIQEIFAGLKDVQRARAVEAARLRACAEEGRLSKDGKPIEPPEPGAESGLLRANGDVDNHMIAGFRDLIRLAAEEVGDLPAAAQNTTAQNITVEINVAQMVAVLSGVVPGKEANNVG